MKKLLLTLLCILTLTAWQVNAQCDYTISGYDQYNDGWDGGSLDIDVAGVTYNYAHPGGANGSTFSIPSYIDDTVTFTWNSGAYDNEVTFTIYAPDGSSLGDYGTYPTVGLFLTNISNSTCAAPNCLNPSALATSGETATTVDLAWTAGDSETLWDLELVDVTASGSATGTPTYNDISTNPYTW